MWFGVKLLFESDVQDGQFSPPLCEESIRLIEAASEADAMKKAEALGADVQHEYKNEAGDKVRWNFVRVVEVQMLCEQSLFDGVEVFSRMFRASHGA